MNAKLIVIFVAATFVSTVVCPAEIIYLKDSFSDLVFLFRTQGITNGCAKERKLSYPMNQRKRSRRAGMN